MYGDCSFMRVSDLSVYGRVSDCVGTHPLNPKVLCVSNRFPSKTANFCSARQKIAKSADTAMRPAEFEQENSLK